MRFVVAIVMFGLTGCHPAEAPAEAAVAKAPSLHTATVAGVRFRPVIELSGSFDPVASVQLGFTVPGRVESLYVARGALVAEGDPMGKLDDALSQAQLAQAEAGLTAAEAQAAAAATSWSRVERLGDALSGQDRTTAEAMHLGAAAQVDQARAAVRMAKTNQGFHTLRAPIGGLVTTAPDNAGGLVAAGMPAFVIEDLSALRLRGSVPESAGWVSDRATVTVHAGTPTADSGVPAIVERVLPSLDPVTRRIPVEIRVDDPPESLRAHGFARAIVVSDVEVDALEIPRGALVARPEFGVIHLVGNTPRFVAVELLEERDVTVVIAGAIAVGDTVVVDPPHGYGE